ncbi:cold shock and DUF1294 domain-containing protein [Comamonadaceae bacterium G21597-S1]|nr:cold shock and DUF1294 domain-containing protein [Comamonadaceae bacterium G21597-S1]
MRFEGVIKTWNEERAFGFITPAQGGQDVFVHITAFPPRSGRPPLNQRVSFELEINRDGKKRARNVMLVRSPNAIKTRPRNPDAQWGGASLFAVPAFVLLYVAIAVVWRVPNTVGLAYLALSTVCFIMYAADKSAAKSGGWRTKESTLLLTGLAGGWPGAMLAQQFLRHKSVKASFRSAFWGTVVMNVIAFVVLSSPQVGAWQALR